MITVDLFEEIRCYGNLTRMARRESKGHLLNTMCKIACIETFGKSRVFAILTSALTKCVQGTQMRLPVG